MAGVDSYLGAMEAIDLAGCRRVLACGALEAKLAPLGAASAASMPKLVAARPAREAAIALESGASSLPRPGALGEPKARAACLARFAHHELQAVELFAWSLLRWTDHPEALARDLTSLLADEQRHCRLYLDRLTSYGMTLADFPCSDYLWRQHQVIVNPCAFLAAIGLTFEQANLDFTLRFADAFYKAGDPASAEVLEQVHQDEIRHVERSIHWLRILDPDAHNDVARYEAAIPFPLSAARAKGRPFRENARRRATLDEALIDHVRTARSSQELAATRRPAR